MNILIIIPPMIPSYFNAGHHLPIFQVEEYLHRKRLNCKAVDACCLNYTWKDICDLLVKNNYDVIALYNDYDKIDGFNRFVNYTKSLSKNSKICTFGRLSHMVPNYFKKYDIDGIVESGDYEAGVYNYILGLRDINHPTHGVSIKRNGMWINGGEGIYLQPEEWGKPRIKNLPHEHYSSLYKDDKNKFCGIPHRKELVFNAARGCPVGCDFCEVPKNQGLKERRVSVNDALNYIQENFLANSFEYVSFYAPTFTLNKSWVYEFCEEKEKRGLDFKWKCVTTLHHINQDIIKRLGDSGCIRISFGIETLFGDDHLPKTKQDKIIKFKEVAEAMISNNIEINCFVILGLPNQTPEDAEKTISFVEGYGARVRPTLYAPYFTMSENDNTSDLSFYNRQIFVPNTVPDEHEYDYYRILHLRKYKDTNVYHKIPTNIGEITC